VKALNHALLLDPEHPELHIRRVEFRKTGTYQRYIQWECHLKSTVASLLPHPSPPIGPVLAESLSKILPGEISLETFNSQYLQRHSSSALAVLASAKVSHQLQAPREEVEAVVFTTLNEDVQLDIKAKSQLVFSKLSLITVLIV